MDLGKIKSVYFIGIGGIGMSALARYFNHTGKTVAGYDKTRTSLTDELESEKIAIHFQDNIQLVPEIFLNKALIDETLIVYTPAIPRDHRELNFFIDHHYHIKKRSEILGIITNHYFTIAVAGTHGKTTTSSIITHLLKHNGLDCTAFLGGITKNYNSNLVLKNEPSKGEREIVVVEADEFDRSFLTLNPAVAIITSMDADHLDIYGKKEALEESYRLFAGKVKTGGTLIYRAGLNIGEIKEQHYNYSINQSADYKAENIHVADHSYVFDVTWNGKRFRDFSLGLPGRHNVENALAACAVAFQLGIDASGIKSGLQSYEGVKRRFDIQVKSGKVTFIDDYAHHPEELRACISSVKELYPGKKITGIFQPHLFSRTRDFADGFAESLSLLDELILLEIYPAREQPIEGVNSSMLLSMVEIRNKHLLSREEVLKKVSNDPSLEVVLTLGAGDIDQLVEPIKQIFINSK